MNQDCFKEYLQYIFKTNIVNKIILKAHLTRFLGIDYVRVIYALISGSREKELIDMNYVYEKLLKTKYREVRDILDFKNFKFYEKLTEIHR